MKYILKNLDKEEELYMKLKFERYCDVSLVDSDKYRLKIGQYMAVSDRLYKQYKKDSDRFFDYDDLISRGEIKIFSKSELKEYLQNWKKEIDQKEASLRASYQIIYQSHFGR